MLGYIVWLISFKVADAVVGTVLGSCRDSTCSLLLLEMCTYLFFILKILTDFRKTVETGMDPRLVTVVLIVKIKGAFNRLYHCCDILLLITLNTTSWMMVRYLNDTNIEHHLMKSHIIHPYKSATSRKCCPESVSSELDSYLSLSFLISKIINSVQV